MSLELEMALLAESRVPQQNAFYQHHERTCQTQEANRQRLMLEMRRAREQRQWEAAMLERQRANQALGFLGLGGLETAQHQMQMQELQRQLAEAQAARDRAFQAIQPVPIQPNEIQIEKVKQEMEIAEAEAYDPSPVFERTLKQVEGIEVD